MTAEPAGGKTRLACWTRLEVAFLLIGLVFGNALIVLTPPFQTADEPQHFFRAWQITQGEFISRERTTMGEQGGYLPYSLFLFWTRFLPLVNHPEQKTSARYILDSFRIPLEPQSKSLIGFGNTAHYFPIDYLPQCAGIVVGRAFSLPLPIIFYLSREANLLVFVLLGYFSLRWSPGIGRPLFLLLLIPMLLCLAASVSADTLTDGLAILFTSLICKEYFSAGPKSFSRGAVWLFLLITLPLSIGKYVYFPLLLLLFLVPAESFGRTSRKNIVLLLLIAVNFTALAAWASATSGLDTRISYDPDVSPSRQLSWLEQNPAHIPSVLWSTIASRGWFACTTYVAVIGWINDYFPPRVVIAYLAMLIIACWLSSGGAPIPWPARISVIVLPAVLISVLGVALLSYMYWTPVGAGEIYGIQGRYFFPLTPAIFLLLASLARNLPHPEKTPRGEQILDVCSICFSLIACGYLLVSVCDRFYW